MTYTGREYATLPARDFRIISTQGSINMDKPDLTTLDAENRLAAEAAAYENELTLPEMGGEIAVPEFKQEDFALVSKAGDFLPRLQLYGGNSDACKEGFIPIGRLGIPRSEKVIDDLGTTVDVLVVHGRPKAMRIADDGTIITKFDPKDSEFQKIADDSNLPDSGCMFGPEFLLYVPKICEFVTFFMSSKTARKASGPVFQRMRKAATLGVELIKSKKYTWHGPTCVPCSAPLDVPSTEAMQKAITKFFAQKESKVETVEAGAETGRAR